MKLIAAITVVVIAAGVAVFFGLLDGPGLGQEFESIGTDVGVGNRPKRVKHLPTGMVLVLIPPGHFTMGTPESEPERDGDEPLHEVKIGAPFYLAETEVTVGVWKRVMGETSGESEADDELPMPGVSWHKAKEFLDRLNAAGEDGWRFPTDAEWEYACRAGTSTIFSFGDGITLAQANYNARYPYSGGKREPSPAGPLPVRSLPPNPWGLYEIHGNVFEWCEDLYRFDPRSEKSSDWKSSPGAARVLRGGSWESPADKLRSGYRDGYPPNSSGPKYGLRVAKSVVRR